VDVLGPDARTVESETLRFLGAEGQLAKWVCRATSSIYHGLIICDSVLEPSSAGAIDFLQECSGRKLHVVCFDATLARPREIAPRVIALPDAPEQLKAHLESEGLQLSRMARVVSERGRLILLLAQPDPETADKTQPRPAFLAAEQSPLPSKRVPQLSSTHGFSWDSEAHEGNVGRVLVPIVQGEQLLNGVAALRYLTTRLHFLPRITIGPQAQALRDGRVLDDLIHVKRQAAANLDRALSLAKAIDLRAPSPTSNVFDHKSGAVFFEPNDWRRLETAPGTATATRLVAYFSERLPHAWSPAHPCYQRVLFTPTKVLLRGEAYYTNMRQESPFERFRLILNEMDQLTQVACGIGSISPDIGDDDWKLVLALLDQIRNIALQTFSFLHATTSALGIERDDEFNAHLLAAYGGIDSGAHGFLHHSIRSYYGWLLHREGTAEQLNAAARCFIGAKAIIRDVLNRAEQIATQRKLKQDARLADLVRGWREADHPGENVLISLLAADALQKNIELTAVGIGWGGIELPMTFDYVSSLLAPSQKRHIYIARYSHYRAAGRKPTWEAFPQNETKEPRVEGRPSALFDDNTLTGLTLEKIRDDLLLRDSGTVHMFVTRYSGERRHHHMQMDNHGVIDPNVLLNDVGGYVGETPFARSWSKNDYRNQVGVFSLARRRILECIYNNSTVELYNREGF
jgi:hypothetical protein